MKLLFKDLSVKLKIILLITSIGGITLFLATIIFVYIDYRNYINNQTSELSIFAKVFGESNSAAIFFEDNLNTEAYLSSLKNAPQISNVVIYNINQEQSHFSFFVDYSIKSLQQKEPINLIIREIDTSWVDGNTVNIFQSIKFRGINEFSDDLIGAIYIQSELPIKQRILQYLKIISLIFGGSSIMAFVLTVKFQGFITKPLFGLQKLVSQVKNDNNYSLRASIESKDEIGMLAQGVNKMLEHIEIQNIELVEAKEQALELVKVKEQFVANMSHEIRTPMNAILGMTNILMENELTIQQLKYLKNIKVSAENLLVIINDILDFSKIQSGNIHIDSLPFNLLKLVKQVHNTLKFSADKKNLKLKYIIGENVPNNLLGDPIRLTQILLNIAGNGIKFTETGHVTMNLRKLKEDNDFQYIQFMVIDTGIGIKSEKLETIFESFQQESTETTRKYGGTGLGLSISKQLIELQNGSISVQSKVGEGSVFTIIIPYKLTDIEAEESRDIEITKSMLEQLSTMNILLAEDNKLNQLVAIELLKKYKIKYTIASDGGEAIDKLAKQKFDAILLDLHMPIKDGFEVAQYIRNNCELNKDILIIALTAAATKVEIDKSFNVGMDKFVSKPFTNEDLVTALVSQSSTKIKLKNEPQISDNVSISNLSYLKTMSGGNITIIKEMVNLFKEQIPQYIADLQTHEKNKDYFKLSEMAHKTKSSLTIVGMTSLASDMKELELKAKEEEDTDTYEQTIKEFVKSVNAGIIELNNRVELLS